MSVLFDETQPTDSIKFAAATLDKTTSLDFLEKTAKLFIKANGNKISKIDSILKINETTYKLDTKNILDVCILLQQAGCTVSFLENKEDWDKTALSLCNFCNFETKETAVNHSPFYLNTLNFFKNTGLTVTSDTTINVEGLFENDFNQVPFKVKEGFLYDFKLHKNLRVIYSTFADEFILYTTNIYITDTITTICKNLDEIDDK